MTYTSHADCGIGSIQSQCLRNIQLRLLVINKNNKHDDDDDDDDDDRILIL